MAKKILAALAEDLEFILSILWRLTTILTSVSGNLIPISRLCRYQAHTWYTDMYTGKTLIHKP